jgi:hypothetical protein
MSVLTGSGSNSKAWSTGHGTEWSKDRILCLWNVPLHNHRGNSLPLHNHLAPCSFRWFTVAESTVHWFIVREKHCWMTADSADPAKQTGWPQASRRHLRCDIVDLQQAEMYYSKISRPPVKVLKDRDISISLCSTAVKWIAVEYPTAEWSVGKGD